MSIKEIKAATRTKTLKLAKKGSSKDIDISRGAKINHEGENTRIVAVHPDGRVLLENGKTVHKAQLEIAHEKRHSSGNKSKDPLGDKKNQIMNWADKHFPSDATKWSQSTDELGTLVHNLHEEVRGSKMTGSITRPFDNPADRNTKLKAALVDLLKKADEGAVKVAAEHFPSILKESTSTSSSGPDKWTRDERGRFA